jgi:alkanesulfonate monooxygenase SsuD/methylene tetrahydromethanopterin reductase-like flavin-dependent oxidoreductase (luciferase family)
MAAERFAGVLAQHGAKYHPFRFGVLLSVYVSETDEQAKIEAREGVWYFLKYCLKGHLRRTGRTLTFGPGVPSTSVKSWEQFLKNSESGGEMLGDADTWDQLDAKASIIVGSPATVRKKLWDIIEQAKCGNLLVQFHFGNMKDELARKSQRLFATEVAPYLRADSKALFARHYPELADLQPAGAAE